MLETRARKRIRRAVEAKGYRLVELTWEPWGAPAEKEGIPGGWEGWVDPIPLNAPNGLAGKPGGDIFRIPDVMGLSVAEALDWVAEFLPEREAE